MDIMIDLETMALTPDAVIRSIGAVEFDLDKDEVNGSTFYCNVNQLSCVRYGLVVNPQTEQWWASQSEEARKAFEMPTPVDLQIALYWLHEWITQQSAAGPVRIWSHGAGFDLPILRYAAYRVGYPSPWSYKNERDTRTLFHLAHMALPEFTESTIFPFKYGVHHNALDDAICQARQVQMSWAVMKRV